MSELAFLSAVELAAKIKNKEISSVELLQLYFDRVDAHNPAINAIVVQDRDGAMARAQEADAALARGEDWGPLHGLPMTVKESYDVEGMPSTWGSPAWKDNIAAKDALSITRLRESGAVIFGKTNVPLMLADFQSYNDVYGTTNNPYNLDCSPGGSSGGSAAALAAGLTGLETGSDIGGSIRNPAHFCGVFGHKPTWNLAPPRGHAPSGVLSASDISVIGPLGRSASDLEVALNVVAGPDEIMSAGYKLDLPILRKKSLGEFKVAVWKDDEVAPVDVEVRKRVELVALAFQDAGASVDENVRPEFTAQHALETYQNLLHPTMSARIPIDQYEQIKAEVQNLDPDDKSEGAITRRAQVASFRDWGANNEARTHLRWQWHEFFKKYDVLLTPVMATAANPHDHKPFGERTVTVNNEQRPYFEQVFWAGLTGVSFLPSTIIPTGLNSAGLPIGVQIVGPEFGDLLCIGTAKLLEQEGFRFTPAPDFL